jgi:hypothetical protein
VTALRENEDRFPFKPVLLIRAGNRRGSLAWFHGQLNRRLGWPRRPAYVWKVSLRSLSTTQDLFHAHFGPAGYRVVDAGLSPTFTSFYGYDASERTTLARWGTAYVAPVPKGCRIRRRGAGNARAAHHARRTRLYDRVVASTIE